MYKNNTATFCCFFILGVLIFSSIVIAKDNDNGKPDLCDKFEDKKNKWEDKWENKEEEDKDWGDKWEEKREKKIDKLDDLKDKFCDECDDDDNDGDDDDDDGGDGGGGDSNNIRTTSYGKTGNIPPIANTSAGEPYIGFPNENIEFDGSFSFDPDGYIIEFIWEFSDGTFKEGEVVFHSFSEIGDYDVILTVRDNDGAINSTNTFILIIRPNNPPTKPVVDGTSTGFTDTLYDFKIISNDFDDDDISYYVDWGDGSNINSQFVHNGTEMIFQYAWNTSGIYVISVKSFDGLSFSETTKFEINIGIYSASSILDIIFFIMFILILVSIYLILAHRNKEKPKQV
jgi:hypothetical protein